MKNTKNMYEIFHDISIAPEFEKENLIRSFGTNSYFKKLVSIIFDPRIEWDLPEGMPPYKRDETIPPDLSYTTLAQELRTMYIFWKPSPVNNIVKKESRYIELLENLHYTEADLLTWIKDGKFSAKFPGVNVRQFMEIFPEQFYFDGIFVRKEWFAIDVTSINKTTKEIVKEFKIISKEEFEQLVSHDLVKTVQDFWTKEFYKSVEIVETNIETKVEPKVVENDLVKMMDELAPKKKLNPIKKITTDVNKKVVDTSAKRRGRPSAKK